MTWNVGGFISSLYSLKFEVATEAAAAVRDVAQFVLAEAIQIVPVEDHDLQSSGKVSTDPSQCLAAVSFDTPYAVIQHEDMTFKHKSGRQAKYLEEPLTRAANGPAQAIIERRLKGK